MADWLLYEHDDGRYAVAPNAEAATFAHGDPKWHRVAPVMVAPSPLPPEPTEAMLVIGLRAACLYDTPESRRDLTRAWREMAAAAGSSTHPFKCEHGALFGGCATCDPGTPAPEPFTGPKEGCEHDWRIWPETDGQEQRCWRCGSYRPTPEEDKFWKRNAGVPGTLKDQP